jgi:hypothetical protein
MILPGTLCRLINMGIGNPSYTLWRDEERVIEIKFRLSDVFIIDASRCLHDEMGITYFFVIGYNVQGWIERDNIVVL